MPRLPDASARILDVAEGLVKRRGYNGFAYKDVAGELGIRNASIHFHFPTKADLGVALARRYRERFAAALTEIEGATPRVRTRLDRFAGLFARTFEDGGSLCLCGMLAAEAPSLPDPVAEEARAFFREARAWLARILTEGGPDRAPVPAERAAGEADLVLAALEGAMIVARGLDDPTRLPTVAADAIARVAG